MYIKKQLLDDKRRPDATGMHAIQLGTISATKTSTELRSVNSSFL